MDIKKAILLIVIISISTLTFAGQPADTVANDSVNPWKFTSLNMLSINQIAFLNWSSGGQTTISGKISSEYDLEYNHNEFTFDHAGKLAFGMQGYFNRRIEKTEDKIDLLWAISRSTSSNWNLTSLLTFKSQFANAFKYPDDSTLISQFMAPGYFNISIGFNHKPNNKFQLYLSPLAGKITVVLNEELSDKGAFGVEKAIVDSSGNIIEHGENVLSEMGIKILTSYKYEIMKNIDLSTTLNLYNNYTDPIKENRWNIDVDWDTRIIFNINKIFSSVLYLHLKYDHNTLIPNYEDIDGNKVMVSESPKLQMKESFGLSFSYRI